MLCNVRTENKAVVIVAEIVCFVTYSLMTRVKHRECNTKCATDGSTGIDEDCRWFSLRIHKRLIKEAVEPRVISIAGWSVIRIFIIPFIVVK